ncbi:hypothetical protein MN608_07152 [Microdochium nivale]|nr:hypothetical protein MN608_07152 [Microdochium nivale]
MTHAHPSFASQQAPASPVGTYAWRFPCSTGTDKHSRMAGQLPSHVEDGGPAASSSSHISPTHLGARLETTGVPDDPLALRLLSPPTGFLLARPPGPWHNSPSLQMLMHAGGSLVLRPVGISCCRHAIVQHRLATRRAKNKKPARVGRKACLTGASWR